MVSATYLQDARIIEDFKARGIWEVETLAGLVADVMDKRAKAFTHSERNFIKLVGMEAFRRTMTQLMKEYESKGV